MRRLIAALAAMVAGAGGLLSCEAPPSGLPVRAAGLGPFGTADVPRAFDGPVRLGQEVAWGPPGAGVVLHGFVDPVPTASRAKPAHADFVFRHGVSHDFGGNRRVPTVLVVRLAREAHGADPTPLAFAAADRAEDPLWPNRRYTDTPADALIPEGWASRDDGVATAVALRSGTQYADARAWVAKRGRAGVALLDASGIREDDGAAIARRALDAVAPAETGDVAEAAALDAWFAALDAAEAAFPAHAAALERRIRAAVAAAGGPAATRPLPARSGGWAVAGFETLGGEPALVVARRLGATRAAEGVPAEDVPFVWDEVDDAIPIEQRYGRLLLGLVAAPGGTRTWQVRFATMAEATRGAPGTTAAALATLPSRGDGASDVWFAAEIALRHTAAFDPDALDAAARTLAAAAAARGVLHPLNED